MWSVRIAGEWACDTAQGKKQHAFITSIYKRLQDEYMVLPQRAQRLVSPYSSNRNAMQCNRDNSRMGFPGFQRNDYAFPFLFSFFFSLLLPAAGSPTILGMPGSPLSPGMPGIPDMPCRFCISAIASLRGFSLTPPPL